MLLTMRPMGSKKRLAIAAAAAAVMLVPTAALSATKTVTARMDSWGPARVDIKRGDTVRWTNPSSSIRIHTVTSASNNWTKSTRLMPGDTTSKRFRQTGTYKFRCLEHSVMVGRQCDGMCGVIRVTR